MCAEKIWGTVRMKSWSGVKTVVGKVCTRFVLILGQRSASKIEGSQRVRVVVLNGGWVVTADVLTCPICIAILAFWATGLEFHINFTFTSVSLPPRGAPYLQFFSLISSPFHGGLY